MYSLIWVHFLTLTVLWHCWLGVRKSIRPVKIEWLDVGVAISLEWGADCLQNDPTDATASQNPFISCLILILTGFTFLLLVSMEKRPLNGCSSSSYLFREFAKIYIMQDKWQSYNRVHNKGRKLCTHGQAMSRAYQKPVYILLSVCLWLCRICATSWTTVHSGSLYFPATVTCPAQWSRLPPLVLSLDSTPLTTTITSQPRTLTSVFHLCSTLLLL